MFAVAVQDAQGRTLPITDNEVTFRISGEGKLIGVGNGDPTDHESDKGTSRKAFSGYCMAVVQSTKSAGKITVEATSAGLTPATVSIDSKAVMLRPQIAVWEREVPTGAGITGLWRPVPAADSNPMAAFLGGGNNMVFTLRQDGDNLTGTVEGGNGGFFGGSDVPAEITEGKVADRSISFKAGTASYTGTLKGDQLELHRSASLGFPMPKPAAEPPGPRPAVGPPPDGSDPSINAAWRRPSGAPMVLHRVER